MSISSSAASNNEQVIPLGQVDPVARPKKSTHSTSTSKLEKSVSRLEKELRSRSHAIEGVALRVVKLGKLAEQEDRAQYRGVRSREIAALSKAARIEHVRCLRDFRRAEKSKLGTSSRLNLLGAFIYETEHYLIPVLERISLEQYKSSLIRLVSNAIYEYSSSVDEFDEFPARTILETINRASKIGVSGLDPIRRKCERALSPTPRKVFVLLESLGQAFWDLELKNKIIQASGDRPLSDPFLCDLLLMTMTKMPESRVRQKIERNNPNVPTDLTGSQLFDKAHSMGLLGNGQKSTATVAVGKGYLGLIRNEPHHTFTAPMIRRVIDALLFTNFVLKLIDGEKDSIEGSDLLSYSTGPE